ncbi:hypothetical protein H310_05066 [Aphanomyces invadans]|uniref:Uncharacterized protein n=1 Tax=Aphanomyces invadans TaxID=157072 RepID=A0A024UBM6_9STRA|nr:hypothetical protein H310_05066 [Aphanomyces invadans]ETW03679.1 hypothetical protein H310_05066 [Aphanomyces invadans]|eukprot:XP_008867908.1 hypothetical protein H310_05066 [Aphanomyces invadans]
MIVNKKPLQNRSSGKDIPKGRVKKAASRQESLPALGSTPRKPVYPARSATTFIPPLAPSTCEPMSVQQPPQDIHAVATRLLGLPREGDHSCGTVHIKFNHYNRSFPIYNGVLQWSDVDAEYCFSFVYRGAYTREVCCISNASPVDGMHSATMQRDTAGDLFIGLVVGNQYEVSVEEDPVAGVGAEGLRVNTNPLFASGASSTSAVISGNAATRLLTQDLRNMHPDNLGSDEAKEIIARRDIEDVLFA